MPSISRNGGRVAGSAGFPGTNGGFVEKAALSATRPLKIPGAPGTAVTHFTDAGWPQCLTYDL